jgi:hypothetical protein
VNGSELLGWLKENPFDEGSADLTKVGIRRWASSSVPGQATLRQAMDSMRTETTEAVYIFERSYNTGKQILLGVVTRESIEKFSLASVI